MNEIKIFENPTFGKVRTTEINGEPYFVGKDVAEILGYKETAKAIRTKVDHDDKGVSVLDTPGGKHYQGGDYNEYRHSDCCDIHSRLGDINDCAADRQ